MHLCREGDCSQPGTVHCKAYAAVDSEAVVDGRFGSPRRISEQGVLRALNPADSESEAEVASDPCEAVLVGLELQGKPRALAPDGCEDRAASEPTRLMEGDVT